MTKLTDPIDDQELDRRLRATFHTVMPMLNTDHIEARPHTGPTPSNHPGDHLDFDTITSQPKPQRRRLSTTGASLLAAAAAATLFVIVGQRDTGTPALSGPPAQADAVIDSDRAAQIPVDSAVDAAAGARRFDIAAGTRFAVADVLPDGWSIARVEVAPGGSVFGSQQWALLDDAGDVSGVVSVRPPRPISLAEANLHDDDFDSTVRGVPADEWADDPSTSGTPEPRSGITWVEDLHQMQVDATGSARELVRPIAESLVVDEQARTVTIPDEFGLTPASDLGLADASAVATSIRLGPLWTGPGLIVYSEPNTFGFDLYRLVGSSYDWEPIQIEDRLAVATRNPAGGIVIISWLDGDMQVTMSSTLTMSDDGALSDEEMVDVARSIRFTDAGEFLAVSAAVTDRINSEIASWTVYDQTATADGIEVSVRTSPDEEYGHALCLDAPIFDCTLIEDDGGLVAGAEAYGAKGFDLADRKIGVVWISTGVDALTTGDPTLRPSDTMNPADGYVDGTTATILADAATPQGRFVIVTIPEGERSPTVGFISNDGTGPLVELTPNLDQQ